MDSALKRRAAMTTTTDDATLLAMIARCDDLWADSVLLDAKAVRLRRQGRIAEADETSRRQTSVASEACELEWRTLRTRAATAAGHEAKFRFAVGASMDAEDFVEIAYLLGHEAGRLGLEPRSFEPDILVAAAA